MADLASNARSGGYYTVTVTDGAVDRIQEHFTGNAC
jgi:hypothetical protein